MQRSGPSGPDANKDIEFNKETIMRTTLVIAIMMIAAAPAMAYDATIEDVPLAPESFYNGSDLAGGFTSGSFRFANTYDTMYYSWEGFAASNVTDNTTPGWGNQYSAIPGSGAGASSNYAVGYKLYEAPRIDFYATDLDGMFVTNTTYAYLSMLNGDAFSKKFGGATGDDEDWFLLTISGELGGAPVGTVEFYLADFRFGDNGLDYIVDDWTWVDLSSLGNVDALTFELASTDNGAFGMNTPAYFAVDNVTPEPASVALLALGAGALIRKRRAK